VNELPTWAGAGAGVKQRELAILSGLLRPTPRPADMARLDWPGLLRLARPSLHPLLARSLRQTGGWDRLPGQARVTLDRAARAAAVTDGIRRALVAATLRRLESAGIPAIGLKGFALGMTAYPDSALRPMQDVDLWIGPEHLDSAALALQALGYAGPARLAAQGPAADDSTRAAVRSLQHMAVPLLLELHATPASLASLGPAWSQRAWSRRKPVELEGVVAHVMHPEDQLIHLALHAARHHQFSSGLLPLVDLAFLLRVGPPEDWDRLAADWAGLRVAPWVSLSLALARDLLGADVPERVAPTDVVERWGGSAVEQMLAGSMMAVGTIRELTLAPTWRRRIRLVAWRATGYYWGGPAGGTLLKRGRGALRRLAYDVTIKLPAHVRQWIGGLTPGRQAFLARRAALLAAELEAASREPRS
jgi:putative nucleotidyltransferase-like protein